MGFRAEAVKAVLFDMDGLMFDTERLALQGWHAAAAALGVPIPDALVAAMRGTGTARCRTLFNEAVPGQRYDEARTIRLQFAADAIARDGLPVKPGLHRLLGWLKVRGLPAVLATSTERETAMRYLDLAMVRNYFSAAVCGGEAAHPKPAPDIFLAAAAAAHTAPGACLVLEDSENGLRAAGAAGCLRVVVPDLTPAPPAARGLWEAKADTLADVIPLLQTPTTQNPA